MFDAITRRRLEARRMVCRLCDPDASAASLAGVALPPLQDWEEWGVSQGLMPMVRAGTQRGGQWAGLPDAIQARLDHGYFDCAFQHGRACDTVARVAPALERAGVDFVLIKGPALAAAFYPDPALRAARDIDLLVGEEDRAAGAAALEGLGYRLDRSESDYQAGVEMTQRLFLPPDAHHLPVELHWNVVNSATLRRGLPALTGAYLRRASHMQAGPVTVRVLGAEDLLLYLAVHAAHQHQCSRVIWLVDILQVLRRAPEAVGAPDRACASGMALHTCLRLIRALFPGTPMDGRDLSVGSPPLRSRVLAGALGPSTVLVPEHWSTPWRRKLFREALKHYEN